MAEFFKPATPALFKTTGEGPLGAEYNDAADEPEDVVFDLGRPSERYARATKRRLEALVGSDDPLVRGLAQSVLNDADDYELAWEDAGLRSRAQRDEARERLDAFIEQQRQQAEVARAAKQAKTISKNAERLGVLRKAAEQLRVPFPPPEGSKDAVVERAQKIMRKKRRLKADKTPKGYGRTTLQNLLAEMERDGSSG